MNFTEKQLDEMIINHHENFRQIAKIVKNDKDAIIYIIKQTNSAMILQYSPSEILNDKECLLAGIKEDAKAMVLAPLKFKKDESFIIEALMVNLPALIYVPHKYLKNENVMKVAVTMHENALCK